VTAARDVPRTIHLDARDNVVVCVVGLLPGDAVPVGEEHVTVLEPIPFGHKMAVRPISEGGDVLKYGEIVGRATSAIAQGAHVHTHNVVSSRLPGQP
jgi:altronate dehydratase